MRVYYKDDEGQTRRLEIPRQVLPPPARYHEEWDLTSFDLIVQYGFRRVSELTDELEPVVRLINRGHDLAVNQDEPLIAACFNCGKPLQAFSLPQGNNVCKKCFTLLGLTLDMSKLIPADLAKSRLN